MKLFIRLFSLYARSKCDLGNVGLIALKRMSVNYTCFMLLLITGVLDGA